MKIRTMKISRFMSSARPKRVILNGSPEKSTLITFDAYDTLFCSKKPIGYFYREVLISKISYELRQIEGLSEEDFGIYFKSSYSRTYEFIY